jgi:hypothetical protein
LRLLTIGAANASRRLDTIPILVVAIYFWGATPPKPAGPIPFRAGIFGIEHARMRPGPGMGALAAPAWRVCRVFFQVLRVWC